MPLRLRGGLHPGIRPHRNPLGKFLFLSSFEWGERKEPWLLLKVFNDEFSAKEPVRSPRISVCRGHVKGQSPGRRGMAALVGASATSNTSGAGH